MKFLILSLLLAQMTGGPQTPNYYDGLTSARAASKKDKKDMIIFFTGNDCSDCEAAWVAFSKDLPATQQYVSTKMNKDDFDGGVFYNMMELTTLPAWIIFTPDGKEKERWNGGWKDASGSPVLFDHTTMPVAGETKAPVKTTTTAPISKPVASNPTTERKTETKTNASATNPPVSSQKQAGGFVLQAGYFGSEANAQNLLSELHQKGFESFEIRSTQQNGTTFFRIISEVYSAETDASRQMDAMTKAGIKTSIKKTTEI